MTRVETEQQRDRLEVVSISCPLCGRDHSRVLYEPWETTIDPRTVLSATGGIRGTQRIVQCPSCDLIYVNPRPHPDVVLASYASATDEAYIEAARGRQATFQRCLRVIEPLAPRGRLLDVGCAAGFFVKAACDARWDAMGVEPCRWLANYGATTLGLRIISSTLTEANFEAASFDVVTMWDVLEHVSDPLGELREIFRILRPGGVLVVNVPDVGTWLARLAGKHWWFFLSVHLTYFTQSTLRAMLTVAGFEHAVMRPHYQSLELGHLMKMVGLYSCTLSRCGIRLSRALRVDGWPLRYYASQTHAACRKPRAT